MDRTAPLAAASAREAAFVERLRALSHPTRVAILKKLSERSYCCCADVCGALPLAQSTVSQHLKVLTESGLVRLVRDGVRSSYSLDPAAVAALRGDLEGLLDSLAETGGAAAAPPPRKEFA